MITWTLLRRAAIPPEEVFRMVSKAKTEAEMQTVADILQEKVYINHLYQVNVREIMIASGNPEEEMIIKHLSIKLRDKEVIKDWRHFQLIKNQLCGKESCAVEFYPPESKLVDTSNQYHLWVFPNADLFPFIFQERIVTEEALPNGKQRPFEIVPEDLMDKEAIDAKMDEHNFGALK